MLVFSYLVSCKKKRSAFFVQKELRRLGRVSLAFDLKRTHAFEDRSRNHIGPFSSCFRVPIVGKFQFGNPGAKSTEEAKEETFREARSKADRQEKILFHGSRESIISLGW